MDTSRWRALVVGVVLIGVFVCGLGMLLPARWHVVEVARVDAPAPVVRELVETSEGLASWVGAWNADPALKVAVGDGPERGVGAQVRWLAGEQTVATLELVAVEPPGRVTYTLAWVNGVEGGGVFEVDGIDDGTLVTWSASGDLGLNPVTRWMGLVMGRSMGRDFGRGLDVLRREAEARGRATVVGSTAHDAPVELYEPSTTGSGAAYEGP